jgi:hypothetical protein
MARTRDTKLRKLKKQTAFRTQIDKLYFENVQQDLSKIRVYVDEPSHLPSLPMYSEPLLEGTLDARARCLPLPF